MTGLIAFALPLVAGVCFLRRMLLLDDASPRWAARVLTAGLGIPLGAGLASTLYFLVALSGIASPANVLAVDGILFAAGLAMVWNRRGAAVPDPPAPAAFRWNWLLALTLAAGLVLVLAGLISAAQSMPYGEWDAWSIWNVRAKLLAGPPGSWKGLVAPPFTGHHDYPLLVPGFIAQVWMAQSASPQWVPAATAFVFLIATLALLIAALALLRSVSSALLAGFTILAASSFLHLTLMQYADLPLACYYLGALALVLLASRFPAHARSSLALAGFFASCAAWTKNEGLLFCLALLLCLAASETLASGWKRAAAAAAPLVLAAAPVLVVSLWFRIFLAPAADAVLRQSLPQLAQKAGDASRWLRIVKALAEDAGAFGQPWSHPLLLLAILAIALRFRVDKRIAVALRTVAFTLAVVFAGYCAVYLFTPQDLAWHLQTSLSRLYGQLWPASVLLFFTVLRPAEQ